VILHAIELHHVGRFRESVRLGPFAPGLNILAAPNESGKSTSLNAAARTLFDRHTTKSEELRALQPAGTDLAPRIAVEFETAAGRFRIEKTFLQKPTSELRTWQSDAWELTAESDLADQRVQNLLQSSLPGRGATKPEHWGFLSFLWARQGEPAVWPGLDTTGIGQTIRSKLVKLELDPIIETLRQRLASSTDSILTSTGQPRKGGPLSNAEEDLTRIDAELVQLRDTRTKQEDALVRYQQAASAVTQLDKEQAERAAAAANLQTQAQAAERLRGELQTHEQALTTAQEKLSIVAADAAQLTQLRTQVTETTAAITNAEHAATGATAKLTNLRTRLDARQTERPQRETLLQARREALNRTQTLLRLREHTAAASVVARQVTKAEATATELATLDASLGKLADLSPAKLRKLESLAEQTRTLGAQLQALGLTVELTPDRDASFKVDDKPPLAVAAGETTTLNRPQTLDLHLPDWGRIVIRSGARETQNVVKELETAHAALKTALAKAEVPTLDAAREAVTQRLELESQQKTLRATFTSQLSDHDRIEDLRDAAASATRRVDTLTTTLSPTAVEQSLSQAELEATEAQLNAAVPAEEKALKIFDRELDQLRTEERAATKIEQLADQKLQEHRSRHKTLDTQVTALTARYTDGLDAAKTAVQIAFTRAEARFEAAKAQLPPDYDKLPERNKRAAASLQQIANDIQARRTERDQSKGTLETLGGQGLYSRETELEEKKAEAILRRDAARAKGWATRIAHDLIEHRKQAATKAVLTPLEQRLTAAFGELTGDSTRQVFLNEQLQVIGIGRTREAMHGFEQLSQGAKEQLLLCLRLAVAQELAADEPQVLILDDVLVNTDPIRQERILDTLAAQANHLQILILTCHPDRYRGVGTAISITG